MNWMKKCLYFVVLLGFSGLLLACSEQGPAEQAGEQVDETVDSIQETLDPSGPAERAGEAIDDAIESIGDALSPSGPAEEAGEAVDEAVDEAMDNNTGEN